MKDPHYLFYFILKEHSMILKINTFSGNPTNPKKKKNILFAFFAKALTYGH